MKTDTWLSITTNMPVNCLDKTCLKVFPNEFFPLLYSQEERPIQATPKKEEKK
jgi:hypothetical protein